MSHPCSDSTANSLFGDLSAEEFYQKHGVQHSEEYIINKRGMNLYTHSWVPTRQKPKGLVMVCHGYSADSEWLVQLTAIGIAEAGFAVHAIDHQGHGSSDSLQGHRAYIPDINPVIEDCISIFEQPSIWSGAILNGAMAGISPKFKPPWPLEHMLSYVAAIVPTWPIVPTKDIPTVSFKEPWKRELAKLNPIRYSRRPRAGTALELLRVVRELETRFCEINIPLLIVHGELDVVTDPAGSEALYNKASSSDKTLKIYKGMWHQLVGEPPENISIVFRDIYQWLEEHATKSQVHGT